MSMFNQGKSRQADTKMNEDWNKAIACLYNDKELLGRTTDIHTVVSRSVL